MSKLADDLERLCCAETEGKFFDLVTDSITEIIAALRKVDAETNTRKVSESTPRAGFGDTEAVRKQSGVWYQASLKHKADGKPDDALRSMAQAYFTLLNAWSAQPETGLREALKLARSNFDRLVSEYPVNHGSKFCLNVAKAAIREIDRALSTDEAGGVQGSEWRKIETAPKDRAVLLCNSGAMATGQWSKLDECWKDIWFKNKLRPTHWMPLPTPPRDGGVQKETTQVAKGDRA